MNDKNKEIGFNSEDDNYSVFSTSLVENVNDSAKSDSITELDAHQQNDTEQFDQWCSEVSDYYISVINSVSDNIEQPTTKHNDSSVDLSVNNEQCLAAASNTPVENIYWCIYIMHAISNTFRIYYDSDFKRDHIKSEIPKLTDCLGNTRLYFSPASVFANAQVECTIVFKAPDGHFYFAPYAFVRSTNKGFKFENSTVFDLEKDANNDEIFSLEMIICKLKNSMFESNDKQEHKTCQIKRFPCGTVVNIDHKLLSSWKINEKEKKMNKNAKYVTPNKLAKLLNSYTAYIVFRRTHWEPVGKHFISEPEILFCSNAFTPVNGSVRVHQYDYSPNKLQIKKMILSRVPSFQNINQYNLQVSCIIPKMYECTNLKNKYLKAKILTSSEQDSRIHPNYKFMDGQNPVDSISIRVDQYDSTLTFTVIKRTVEEWEADFILNQGLPVSSSNISTVRTVPLDSPSINSFRVQLQLCDKSSNTDVSYPKSTVISELQDDGFTTSGKPIASPLPANDNLTDETMDQASTHVKRSFERQSQDRTGSPLLKNQKQT